MTERPAALLAMCRPDYFDVSYSINPWMNPSNWQSHSTDLFEQLKLVGKICAKHFCLWVCRFN